MPDPNAHPNALPPHPSLDALAARLPQRTDAEIRAEPHEYLDVADAFAEIMGVSKEEMLRRAAAHKAQRTRVTEQPS